MTELFSVYGGFDNFSNEMYEDDGTRMPNMMDDGREKITSDVVRPPPNTRRDTSYTTPAAPPAPPQQVPPQQPEIHSTNPISINNEIYTAQQYKRSQQQQQQSQSNRYYNTDVINQQQQINTSLVDKFSAKKRDVIKLLMFSLVIVIALGIHSALDTMVKRYISVNEFTDQKEYMVRFMYPVTAFIVLWCLKVFNK